MPDLKYEQDTQRFDCLGVDLNRPVDSVKTSKFPFLQNCRSFQAGRVEPRDGITRLTTSVIPGQSPVHSIRRLNEPLNNSYVRVIGAGTHLAVGVGPYLDIDDGYSGDPLALVPWKPADSPYSFMYIADSKQMRKVNVNGTLHQVGWPHPPQEPLVSLEASPKYKTVDKFNDTGPFTQYPSATVIPPGLISRTPGLGDPALPTTIAAIIYDDPVSNVGWASVVLDNMTGVGPGEMLDFQNEPDVVVQVSFPNSPPTTIGNLIYDTGFSGPTSIAFTTPINTVFADALLYNQSRGAVSDPGTLARITSVHLGPNGTPSVRCSTPGTWQVGDQVSVQSSIRVFLNQTHAVNDPVSILAVQMYIDHNGVTTLTRIINLDLSDITTEVAAQPSDFMHISFRVSDVSQITELRVQLNVDSTIPPTVGNPGNPPATPPTNAGFSQNYYFKAFRPNDITSAITGLVPQSIQQNRGNIVVQQSIVNQPNATPEEIKAAAPPPVIDPNTGEDIYQFADYTYTNPVTGVTFQQTVTFVDPVTGLPVTNNTSQQIGAGTSQWAELIFPISELIRIGTDTTRTLANVNAIQIYANVQAPSGQPTSVFIAMSSWWIGGGYGLDNVNATAAAYKYRYRAREKSTNVASNWSPASRYDLLSHRQAAVINPPQYIPPTRGTTLGPADFVLDIERFGGQLTDWHYMATIENVPSDGSQPHFTDFQDDNVVGGQPIIGEINYQPWPVIGPPVSGTTASVAGTTVGIGAGSGTFDTRWAAGTRILIDGIPYTIRRVINEVFLETLENAGARTFVNNPLVWRVDAPTILAQPLPVLWEWDGVWFACGDPNNAGRLYYSNQDSETTQPTQWMDLTAPSDPLMNGVQYNTRSFVWSSEGFIHLLQTGNPDMPYRHEHIPSGKGLFSRWAATLTPTPILCSLSKDGINLSLGGSPLPLTDADLYPLFPNEGNLGMKTNGIAPPFIDRAFASELRMSYHDEFLYFDFPDTDGARSTLVLAFDLGAATRGAAPGGWFYDKYTPEVIMHYGEEGANVHSLLLGTVGENLYQYTGNNDDGTPILMLISTPSRDQGNPRQNKFYGDIMLDAYLANLFVSVTPFFNNNILSGPTIQVTNPQRSQVIIPTANMNPLNGSAWQTARNISLFIEASVTGPLRPLFYIWEPRWTFESAPLAGLSWEISPTTLGMPGFKHIGLVYFTHVSRADIVLSFTIDGKVQPDIVIPNSHSQYLQQIFRVPVMKFKLLSARVAAQDNLTDFRLDTRDTYIEVKDWGLDHEYSKLRIFGDFSMVEG